jgi:hypothetical protein
MAYCTQLEWDHEFPFDRYEAITIAAGSDGVLPEGCLTRIVGRVETGARIFEIWESPDDARRFGEKSAALLSEFRMPPPARAAAFELVSFQAR